MPSNHAHAGTSLLTLLWFMGNSPPVFMLASVYPLDVLASVPRYDSSNYIGKVSSYMDIECTSVPVACHYITVFLHALYFVCYFFHTGRCVWCRQHPNFTWHYSRRHTGTLQSCFSSWFYLPCLLFLLTTVNSCSLFYLWTSVLYIQLYVFMQCTYICSIAIQVVCR